MSITTVVLNEMDQQKIVHISSLNFTIQKNLKLKSVWNTLISLCALAKLKQKVHLLSINPKMIKLRILSQACMVQGEH